ncbi:HDOD domain-containing protein [Pulveribacter sp.]|uniref:HDOD domain-containing protein n=1 Tax=Pulveribacter sp. TaxID=2678893 RepID=UPI00289676AC|nr:HDOD domain-containing protein [Pulveribacter sp.]
MDLPTLLAQPLALPSVPRVVALLMSALAAPEPDLRRVNQLFATDPALAARLLEEANRPAHGAHRQIAGVAEALALLDAGALRALVASSAVGTTSGSVPGMNLQQFWRYSVHTAKLARSLAGLVHHSPLAAYTAGLLHGLGELVLHTADPGRMESINTLMRPLQVRRARLEQHLLGYSYAQVSAALAERWQLPEVVVDAVRHHTLPLDNPSYEPLAGVLHLASWAARAREAGMDEREMAGSFPGEVGVVLGLDIDVVLQQDPIDWRVPPQAEYA